MAITGMVLNQYAPGGVASQLNSRVGVTGASGPNQYYSPGGAWGQTSVAGGYTGPYNQYAAGGPVAQFVANANAASGATGP
jgi:hypothetical protein